MEISLAQDKVPSFLDNLYNINYHIKYPTTLYAAQQCLPSFKKFLLFYLDIALSAKIVLSYLRAIFLYIQK